MKEFLRDNDDEIAPCDEENVENNDEHQFLSSLADFIKFNDEH